MQNDTMIAGPQSDKSSMMKTIVIGVLVLALLGVSFWGFKTNSTLKATQGELAATQGELAAARTEIDGLIKDMGELTSSLEETTAVLETTTNELATTSASLTKTTGEKSALAAKISEASKYVDVAIGFWDSGTDLDEFDELLKATGDAKLLKLWNDFLDDSTQANLDEFVDYMNEAVSDSLK